MEITVLLIFIPACFALNCAPGPNNLLALGNAARFGWRFALMAGLGRMMALVLMLGIASVGLSAIFQLSVAVFWVIKVAGALYLFYLAVQLWQSDVSHELHAVGGRRNLATATRQEFLVAAGNPKALLIFTAFLPQFVDPASAMTAQFGIVGALFLILEIAALSIYAALGAFAHQFVSKPRTRRIFNRSCGGLLGSAGVGLLFSQPASS